MKEINLQKIILIGGAEVWVDFNQRRVPCGKCKKLIRFGTTKNSRLMPIIENGDRWQSHFADCESAADFRKPKIEQRIDDEKTNQEFLSSL